MTRQPHSGGKGEETRRVATAKGSHRHAVEWGRFLGGVLGPPAPGSEHTLTAAVEPEADFFFF